MQVKRNIAIGKKFDAKKQQIFKHNEKRGLFFKE
jgi:hypothetical protein